MYRFAIATPIIPYLPRLLLQLTEEQILALAPDDSSRKSGKDLSTPAKWVSNGANEQALWGECRGSGSKPYQTQVDLTNIAFKCSCPSRKFPCKHGLGLLLLYARYGSTFTEHTMPSWVVEWVGKRAEREEKKVEKKDKPVDEVAQEKRRQARERGVEDGLSDLLLWIKDIVRNGILTMPDKRPSFFTDMARRLVDAKAPGLAAMIRRLGETNFYAEDWHTAFMDQLVCIYLVITGFTNRTHLSSLLAEDIYSAVGFTQDQEELKKQQGTIDVWLVLGKQTTEEDNLTVERTWLYGTQSRHYALVLQFSVQGQGLAFSLTPGMTIEAELVFFPSVQPLRAVIKQQRIVGRAGECLGYTNWQEVAAAEASINRQLPFNGQRPVIIEQVKPVQYNGLWWLVDSDNSLVRLKEHYPHLYTILALSGGEPLNMAVIGREHTYEPLGVWVRGDYLAIG